jgi:hypothetical protein
MPRHFLSLSLDSSFLQIVFIPRKTPSQWQDGASRSWVTSYQLDDSDHTDSVIKSFSKGLRFLSYWPHFHLWTNHWDLEIQCFDLGLDYIFFHCIRDGCIASYASKLDWEGGGNFLSREEECCYYDKGRIYSEKVNKQQRGVSPHMMLNE